MAQGDSDDDSSRYRRDEGDPVRLRVASNGTSWILNMGMEFRSAGISAGDYVEVDFIWDEDGPMLLLGQIPSDEAEDSQRARKVTDRGSTLSVKPSKEFLEDDPEFGLGLDIDAYDNDNPLLLEPMVMEGSVGLIPIGFADELEQEPVDEDSRSAGDQDDADVDEDETEPEHTDVGHPVALEAVATAAQLTGVDDEDLGAALEAIAETVTVEDVERVEDFDLLEADGRVVAVVEREQWSQIGEEVGLENAVAEAARMAHTQHGEDLAVDYGGSEFKRFSRRYSAVVFDDA